MIKEKREQRIKVGPVGEVVLASIAIVGVVSLFALLPGVTVLVAPFLQKKKYSHRQAILRNVESLVRTGLVKKTVTRNGEVRLELTKKGRWESLLRGNSQGAEKTVWDGVWSVVIFDVPKTKNQLRRELRRSMSLFGFKMLQQSVWVYPYACDEFVGLVKSHLGVEKDVLYMRVKYIENDKFLRKEFGI